MNDTLPDREVAPEQTAPPVLQHTDALPAWLAPGADPVPPSRLSNPVLAWSGTLVATALMVAFGLWLGDTHTPVPAPAVASVQAPAVTAAPIAPPTAPFADVPPLVLVDEPVVPAKVAPAPLAPAARVVPGVRRASPPRRQQAAPTGRAVARVKNRPQPMTASTAWRKPVVAAAGRTEQTIRCRSGELVRECLARYR